MAVPNEAKRAGAPVRIWDGPVRLFHWLLVGLLACSWWTGEHHEMEWHRLSGYGILGLLLFRLYWGIVGGRTARFAGFVRGPRAVIGYVRSIGRATYRASFGHNPLGGWSVVAILATLAAMVAAGLFAVDVDGLESGPLADYVSFDQGRAAARVHHFVFNLLLGLSALHVLAILAYLLVLRQNLILPMIGGGRSPHSGESVVALGASVWKALVGIVAAAAITYAVAMGFRF